MKFQKILACIFCIIILFSCKKSTITENELPPSKVVSHIVYSSTGNGVNLVSGENYAWWGDSTCIVDSVRMTDIYFRGIDSSSVKIIGHPKVFVQPSHPGQFGLLNIYEDTTVRAIQCLSDTSLESVREVPENGFHASIVLPDSSTKYVCAIITRNNYYGIFKITKYGSQFTVTSKVQTNGTRTF